MALQESEGNRKKTSWKKAAVLDKEILTGYMASKTHRKSV